MRTTSSALSAALLVACASESALDITLVPDPERNSAGEVVGLVDRMELVVDSDDGLYPPGRERIGEHFEIREYDGDPSDLELVASIPIDDRLPTILLERGSLPDARIELLARGYDSTGRIVATGGMSGAEFRDGVIAVALPFDLVPGVLPLRVTEVFPSDTDLATHCTISRVVALFSRAVDPASVLGAGSVEIEPGSVASVSVDAESGRFLQIVPMPIAGTGDSVSYRLTIATSVTDEAGEPLDQNANEDGLQPFERTFRVPCTASTKAPMRADCGTEEPGVGECPGDLVCGPAGSCQAVCRGGEVCSDSGHCAPDGTCIEDCRAVGGDPCAELRCDPATGACI
jgi:hypothetical protein